jgi:hypothetical protein
MSTIPLFRSHLDLLLVFTPGFWTYCPFHSRFYNSQCRGSRSTCGERLEFQEWYNGGSVATRQAYFSTLSASPCKWKMFIQRKQICSLVTKVHDCTVYVGIFASALPYVARLVKRESRTAISPPEHRHNRDTERKEKTKCQTPHSRPIAIPVAFRTCVRACRLPKCVRTDPV